MRPLTLLISSIYFATMAFSQVTPCTVKTIAGPSTFFAGDGGPATSAYFSFIGRFRFDQAGNLFIPDTGNQRIRKVSPDGTVTTIAGTGVAGFSGDGGPAISAQLYLPVAVSPDNQGNLYIADGDNRIRKIDTNGIITTYAGNGTPNFSGDGGPASAAEIQAPADVLADAHGNVFIADTGNFRVRKIDSQGIISTVAGSGVDEPESSYRNTNPPRLLGGSATAYSLADPESIAVDSSGNLFIADVSEGLVFQVDSNGVISAIAGTGQPGYSPVVGNATSTIFYPYSLAVSSSDELAIASPGSPVDGGVFTVSNSGVVSQIAPTYYSSIAFNQTTLYGQSSNSIYLAGTETLYAGAAEAGNSGDGAPAVNANFVYPGPIAVSSSGDVYVADPDVSELRKIEPDGIITHFAGTGINGALSGDGGPATVAGLGYIQGLAVDASGNVYISSSGSVRKIDTQGIISTLVGLPAQLIDPSKLAVDPSGNIYVQEEMGVFVFTLDGIQVTPNPIVPEGEPWTLDALGNLYWGASYITAGNITKSSPEGEVTTVRFGSESMEFAADSSGDLFLWTPPVLQEFTSTGQLFKLALLDESLPYTTGPALQTNIGPVFSMVSDAFGNLYYVDPSHWNVRELTAGCPVIASQPLIDAVVNSASYDLGAFSTGLSAGELVALFGVNLGPTTGVSVPVTDGAFPTQFEGVTVSVNGHPAPLLYIGQGQVNFVVPFETEGERGRSVQITYNGVSSDVYHAEEAEADPGIFAIANPDGSANSATNPVAAGSYVVIYGTGQGISAVAQADGAIEGSVLANPSLPITAAIDAQPAPVLYAGSAPGLVAGVLQVNLSVPTQVTAGQHTVVKTAGTFFWDNSHQASEIYTK